MKAKEFLQQVKKLDKMIENKLIEVEQWKEIANNTTANMTGDRVQTSGNPQKMADAIATYIGIQDEINRCIDELIDIKKGVISVIEQLNATEYDILHKVYIQSIPLYDVAEMYDRTYSWVTTIHGRALKHVQIILDKQQAESI